MKQFLWIALALTTTAATACSGSSPTTPAPAQVAGVWTGTVTFTSVSGGECVGALFQAAIGQQDRQTLSINQSGSNLTATSTSQTDGSSCTYTGTAGASSLTLNVTSCTASDLIGITCSNGSRRDLHLQTGAITASVNGNTGSGTYAETDNIVVAGTATAIAIMVINGNFTMTRQ